MKIWCAKCFLSYVWQKWHWKDLSLLRMERKWLRQEIVKILLRSAENEKRTKASRKRNRTMIDVTVAVCAWHTHERALSHATFFTTDFFSRRVSHTDSNFQLDQCLSRQTRPYNNLAWKTGFWRVNASSSSLQAYFSHGWIMNMQQRIMIEISRNHCRIVLRRRRWSNHVIGRTTTTWVSQKLIHEYCDVESDSEEWITTRLLAHQMVCESGRRLMISI